MYIYINLYMYRLGYGGVNCIAEAKLYSEIICIYVYILYLNPLYIICIYTYIYVCTYVYMIGYGGMQTIILYIYKYIYIYVYMVLCKHLYVLRFSYGGCKS
jgi:hypothetical protein